MADVLFVTWDGGGNLPPALGIATEMRQRGHSVRFLGHLQQREVVESAGFRFRPYTHARTWSSIEPVGGLRAAVRITSMFTDRGPGADLLAEVESEPADLVVLDCMSLGALDAAERAGIRCAVLVHTYYGYLTSAWSRGPVGIVARLKRLDPRRLWAAADLLLVATDRALDPCRDADLPASARYVGVVQPAPLPSSPDGGAARVLVSLSTTYFPGQDTALQSVLDALAALPVRAVVTCGPAVDPAGLRPAANTELHRHLPHAAVMPGVAVVVGHGGHATTMRALAHDAPLVILPMHPMLDQTMIGQSIATQGAAIVLARTASAQEIQGAIRHLLEAGTHTTAAARLGARLRAQNGATTAADHLDGLLCSAS